MGLGTQNNSYTKLRNLVGGELQQVQQNHFVLPLISACNLRASSIDELCSALRFS